MTQTSFLELFFERLIRFYESFTDLMLLPIDYIIEKIKYNKSKHIK